MERDAAIVLLPDIYQQVLECLDSGCSGDEIAVQLGIDANAVPPLIGLARAKLSRLEHEASPIDLEVPVDAHPTGDERRRPDGNDRAKGVGDVQR